MAKFSRKGKGGLPAISTASLPDIVFMILMFFMVSTSMRQTDRMVKVTLPQASEIIKLERKDLASYIYVGTPLNQYQAKYGTDSRIQLNDSFRTIDEIRDFIAAERENLSESDRPFMTVSIKADEDTRMGIITDIKQELRRCSALKIMYGAR
ncbi:MAG: biopolymer transporter ExbD [Bacteroidales bacterium]|jgi:biopolymer transport protein ExbD|nr:biopolymer transporter ExbD [Bacteroidales bacterium]MBO6068542.1 biopolymer transporter ExbD [Bacteroidales bacterium]MBO7372241.1 biopolymer transporter ExbD [Bacteroidales bacterium]MBO7488460.1 biopolymer transporter ExbD [Bacteroidales bacterium]MBO7584937.1 biopolymer transporter ExbD [Bacteroidales bacterium]